MLCNIDIKNVAVIEEMSFEPQDGMSVLTGETGAGKSVIIDCVNMILGERTNKALIRHGEKKAVVCAMFTVTDELREKLLENGIEAEDDVIIQREITTDGKSIARINGTMVPISFLRDISYLLIDMHGQHDNQILLNASSHIDFLDSYADLYEKRNEYNVLYKRLKKINDDIEELSRNEQERLSRIDLLKYQVDELSSADLKTGEEEELKEESVLISSSEKLSKNVMSAYAHLYDNENNVYDELNKAIIALAEVVDYDKSLLPINERLNDALYTIQEIAGELRDYADKTEFDEQRLDEIAQRLDLIKKLERKYGKTINDCLSFLENATAELDLIINRDEKISELIKEKDAVTKQMEILSSELSAQREIAAKKLSDEIENQIHDLDMIKARFLVDVKRTDEFRKYGKDIVEFMFTANPGQPLGELSKIASGGELSRVMLSMKTVLSKDEGADTLIFDEIDTGVSGNAALKIAKKLSDLGKFKQVICVSHLPQLAAMADNNFKIEKLSDNEKTTTKISLLSYEERLGELARMIDGENITNASLEHAREMLDRRI